MTPGAVSCIAMLGVSGCCIWDERSGMTLRLVSKESAIRTVLWTDDDRLANGVAESLNEVKKVVEIGLTCEVMWPEAELDVCVVEEVAGKSDAADVKGK